ncbi:MAG: WD40 repeat domain-containing protein, partial [Thermomicrobiales bacterium]
DVLLWDLQNPIPLAQRLDAGAPVASVAIAADGRTLAAGTSAGSVELWGAGGGERIWSSGALPRPVTSVVLAMDGRTVTASSQDGVIYRWDTAAAAEPLRLEAHAGSVDALATSPDGQTLAAGGADGMVRLWDLAQPAAPPSALAGHQGLVSAVAFSPEGTTLASGGADGAVRAWHLGDGGDPIVLEGQQGQIFSVAFRPRDVGTLVAGGRGLSFWDVATGQRISSLAVGSDATVYGVAFSPDGATLATAAADGRITLWDMGTNLELGALNGHTAAARSVSYSDDGTLVSGGDDGTVLVWSISTEAMLERACRIANRNLTPEEWEELMLNRPDQTTCPEFASGDAPVVATP